MAGHRSRISGEVYSIVYPNGLEIALGQVDQHPGWGHWKYDRETGKKNWIEVQIPDDPKIKVIPSDGTFIEAMLLTDKWLETHPDVSGETFREYIAKGIDDFLKRTGQK